MSQEIAQIRIADCKPVGRGYYIAGQYLLKIVDSGHLSVVGVGYGR